MDNTRALYIIVEGQTDAQILHTLLKCSNFENVYHIPTGGYGNMSSMARTIRLMRSLNEANDKILVVFDTDSEKKDVIEDRLDTMRYLTSADFDKRIGVFCFVPDIERSLFPSEKFKRKVINDDLVNYMREHIEELRSNDVIREMQAFIDE
jgi:5S rRNA maturation endonuclease (ribonuclease M5)